MYEVYFRVARAYLPLILSGYSRSFVFVRVSLSPEGEVLVAQVPRVHRRIDESQVRAVEGVGAAVQAADLPPTVISQK